MAKLVENLVDNSFKTMLKTLENFGKQYQKFLSIVYKISFHQLFQTFSTNFYTNSCPLSLINYFHYSTYPTTMTTIYYLIEERS